MKELQFLHPRDENVSNMDDWPLLDLHDAIVSSSSGEMHDMLDVFDKGPFQITGRLGKVAKEWRSSIVKSKSVYDQNIAIQDVITWGVERTENGDDIKVWALGAAGWYSLHPAPEYKTKFKESVTKGRMWLFFQDKYEGIKSNGKRIQGTMERLCKELSSAEPVLGSPSDVQELFKMYRRFFIMKMLESKSKYMRVPLYRYYREEFRVEFPEIERAYKKHSGASTADNNNVEEGDDVDEADLDMEPGSLKNEPTPPLEPSEHRKTRGRRKGRASKDKGDIIAPKKSDHRVTRSRATTRSGTPMNKSRQSSKGTSVLRPSTRSTRNNTIASPLALADSDGMDEGNSSGYETAHSQGHSPEPVPMIDFGAEDGSIELDESSETQWPQQRAPVLELFDDNSEEAMNNSIDLREEAIKQLTNLHLMYDECTQDWSTNYPRYKAEFRRFFEWRKTHNLRPIYVDYICWKSSPEFDIDDDVVLEHIPNTEYLINLKDWDSLDSAIEYLQDVNRTAQSQVFQPQEQQHLQPLRKSRGNIANAPAKANSKQPAKGRGRGRPAKKNSAIKCLRLSIDPAEAKALRLPMAWKCAGVGADGQSCSFTVENSTSDEGFQAVADHWKSCELRKVQAEKVFHKKRDLVSEAHKTAIEFQTVVDPDANINNLIDWIEAEARRSAQFPIDQF